MRIWTNVYYVRACPGTHEWGAHDWTSAPMVYQGGIWSNGRVVKYLVLYPRQVGPFVGIRWPIPVPFPSQRFYTFLAMAATVVVTSGAIVALMP